MSETLTQTLPPDVDELAGRVAKAACDAELRLVTAESCTGGLLASLLTDIEGCSHAFDRGFVVYTEAAKRDLLAVPQSLLDTDGAVSAATARAMACGALAASEGDIALAVTGFAGRGAPGEEPGLVHFALVRRGGKVELAEKHFGDAGRGPVRLACLRTALKMLERELAAWPKRSQTAA